MIVQNKEVLNMGNDKYFPGSIIVGEDLYTNDINAKEINGVPSDEYVTTKDIPNTLTLKDFTEEDGGLFWKGSQLIPPNSVMEDRAYTDDEILKLIDDLWK